MKWTKPGPVSRERPADEQSHERWRDTDHKHEEARQRAGSWAVRSRVGPRGQKGKREMRP